MSAREAMQPMIRRQAAWSDPLTSWLADRIPPRHRDSALTVIKGMHTAIFWSVAAAIALFLWDGLVGRPTRRGAYAMGIAVAETTVYVSNNQVCPLTPLAEELGEERGSVVDLFLPDWAARRIPVVAGSALVLAVVLNVRGVMKSRPRHLK